MIFVIHGDNFSRTRKVVTELQQKLGVTNKQEADINNITPQQLKEMCGSYDLFSTPPFVVIDISGAGRKNLSEYMEVLKAVPPEVNVVIQSNKELSKANIFIKNASGLKAKTVLSNIEPTSDVFKLIDALFTRNRKNTYKELRNLLNDDAEPYYILTMISYGLRNLAYAVTGSPLLNKMHPFAKSKALTQAKNYDENRLKELYALLYKTDKDMKTGKMHPEIAPTYVIEQILK